MDDIDKEAQRLAEQWRDYVKRHGREKNIYSGVGIQKAPTDATICIHCDMHKLIEHHMQELTTLPEDQLSAGMAEMVGLMAKSVGEFFVQTTPYEHVVAAIMTFARDAGKYGAAFLRRNPETQPESHHKPGHA